ncbi:MAG: glycosyltransferase [Cetobacterium sp.]
MKKITVIIPVYNRLEHLRASFLCLLNQNVKPYELIISDDGSSEKVIDFLEDLIPKADFKIKVIYQQDIGFRKTRALNNAVRNAEGEILVFCDQDLIFPKDHLENIEKTLKKREFVNYRPQNTDENEKNNILELLNQGFTYEKILKKLELGDKIHEKNHLRKDRNRRWLYNLRLNKRGVKLVGMSYALYKEDYIEVNGYNEEYQGWGYEDDDFGNRLYSWGIKGREIKDNELSFHLWHHFDPTKKESSNEELYRKEKIKALKNKRYRCEYGYDNIMDKDEVTIEIIKGDIS